MATAQINAIINQGSGRNSRVQSRTFPLSDITRHITLAMQPSGVQYGYYGAYKLGGTGGQYQVPGGKTLYCTSINMNAGGALGYMFGYSTATFTEATLVAPTGAVYYGAGTTSAGANTAGVIVAPSSIIGIYEMTQIMVSWAASKYPFIQTNSTLEQGYILLDCIEV